ncbi:MAG: MDR family oxidoreductase [Candidatus Methylumidiphilus sp.]
MFKALLIDKSPYGTQTQLAELDESTLPTGDVTVAVEYSSLNYKDALAITGKAPIVRSYPMVPGIDLAGVVEASAHPDWKPGDRVLANGWGLGESHWGGMAQKARLRGDWMLALPEAFSSLQAMSIGTAGYTAMLCVMALERHGVKPGDGDVLVTGAKGGVGGVAVMLLAQLGYSVVVSTGRMNEPEYLRELGAVRTIDRSELSQPGRPLGKERWAAAIDSLGSQTLANVCAGLKYRGVVASCGRAQGTDFPATVLPFILRGITLAGVDSVHTPMAERREAWRRLAQMVDFDKLQTIAHVIGLTETKLKADELLSGWVRGRLVVDVNR